MFIILGKPEKRCFHAIGEQHEKEGNICIQFTNHAIFGRQEKPGIHRNKQVV